MKIEGKLFQEAIRLRIETSPGHVQIIVDHHYDSSERTCHLQSDVEIREECAAPLALRRGQ